jgi:hypothetical protein
MTAEAKCIASIASRSSRHLFHLATCTADITHVLIGPHNAQAYVEPMPDKIVTRVCQGPLFASASVPETCSLLQSSHRQSLSDSFGRFDRMQ